MVKHDNKMLIWIIVSVIIIILLITHWSSGVGPGNLMHGEHVKHAGFLGYDHKKKNSIFFSLCPFKPGWS
jgi:preprotein translocase subunit SecG